MNGTNDEPNRAEARRQIEKELSLNPNDALSEYQLGELMWIETALMMPSGAFRLHRDSPQLPGRTHRSQ